MLREYCHDSRMIEKHYDKVLNYISVIIHFIHYMNFDVKYLRDEMKMNKILVEMLTWKKWELDEQFDESS